MEFKQIIKMYLDCKAQQDQSFVEDYANKDKSLDECCLFIQYEMYKRATDGKEEKQGSACCVPTDDEVFALAVHYYKDKDLKVDGTAFGNVKCVSMSATSFTDEEKAKMREEAIKKYQDGVIAECRKKDQERKAKAKDKEKKPTNPVIVPETTETKEETKEETKSEKPKAVQMDLFA